MEKNNLSLWEAVRYCPREAQRTITGGRLNNFTDISPIWRMKVLTEQFGPCGFGWYYEITDKWNEADGLGQIATFVQINLYVKNGDEWSKPIVGMGGSAFVKKEGSDLYTSDEAYKMALTDAISVSCKALGVAADIYWSKDNTKYTTGEELMTKVQETTFESLGITKKAVASHFKVEVEEITKKQADKAIAMQLDAIKRSKKTEVKDAEHTNE
jgi:hypothetical protein